ncbi:response regulator transcription factor [Candidatus Synechococcus calcipolaris G9]|uniref:Response regulator transcription factor n=1 Tax=Candidatus Synechococcus calcipolaris G9 TaxID=1497997 RepID=A0ABT6F1W1_9SYNE|nr:response regulator transcription factor [Candidatus Synechococcus calcipolaris]MDG2991848.1 response regulator transcription factor [Candidatus Synechococcus calcipolaris G9]
MATVMVVDDSPTLRAMIVEIMQSQGLQVVEAEDGLIAQEKIKAQCPDLVVLDVVMPRMNGYELCRWIKGEAASKDVPVIMCTTKSEDFDIHWGKKQGVDAYITKPFEPGDLIAKVKELLKT